MLQKFDEAIISQAYPVFEVKDENILLPEFLMMWFSRPEFDREACFYAVGGVRGSLEWDDFCNMKLPIPSIETQRAIVAEYNSVKNRIALNNQLIQKLEETAQAIYKQWFVDFEFPDKNGKPYKSSGGKMVFNEELEKEIPEGWEVKPFTEIVKLSGGGTPDTNNGEYWNGDIPFFTPADVVDSFYSIQTEKNVTEKGLKNSNTKLYPKDTVFVTARGTVGAISISGCEMTMNQSCYAITGKNGMNQFFTHQISLSAIEKLKKEALGAVFAALVTKDFDSQILVEPDEDSIKLFGEKIEIVYDYILTIVKENQKLSELKGLLLSKLAKLEN
ncbi:restriction endonuclease subunit S [Marinilabilia salmonicolor]|uniref:restriction endonuclease subunit S n=1 Tax=Marinilabilia salmonicolor TaxID=989 RepID=UPI001C62650C|nr:restriction endonuclease subunit S [Marinilabilia salmonicolor]